MAFNVSEQWKNKVYGGDKSYVPYLLVNNNYIDVTQLSQMDFIEDVIDNESETMYLGTFRANQIDITFKNLNNLDIQSNMPVYLEMGLNTNYKAIQSKYKYEQDGLKYFEVLNSEEMSYLDLNHYVNVSINGVMYERLLIQKNIFPDENVIYFGIDLWQIPSINTSDEIIIYPYEYIPKGYYLIEEPDENYHKTCKITCLDYSVKMKTNCDYSSALDENGEITLENLLQWLCINYSVKLGTYPNVNRDMKISVYDSTLSGKAYVSYIAEMMGGNAKFNRNNELCIIPLKQESVETINALKSSSLKIAEKYEISRVYYTDGSRVFEYGENAKNTLQIRQENMFVVGSENVENIFNSLNGLVLYSLENSNVGDPSLDCWDTITLQTDENDYPTINNCTLTYAITIMTKINTQIPTKQQEQTTNVVKTPDAVNIKRIQSEINQLDGSFKIFAEDINKKVSEFGDNYYSKGQIEQLIIDAVNGLVNTFTTTGGDNIFRNTGLWYRSDKVIKDETLGEYKELEYWTGNAQFIKDNNSTNTRAMSLLKNKFEQIQNVKNGTYTISFTYKKTIPLSTVYVTINGEQEELTAENYTEYVKTIQVSNGTIDLAFETNTNNSCIVYDLMVNVGETKLPYNQNQNETTTDSVQISKGITIQSSDTNTEFKADSDGIRIKDNLENTTTNFTNVGMETKQAKITNQADITRTLWQRVNGQTWISWLGDE